MIAVPDLDLALSRLAEHFEKSAQVVGGVGRGWGQFLDAPKSHSQVGPYGTCAGLIVLTLAGRGQSATCRDAAKLLSTWWSQRAQGEYPQKRFVQTLRLALLVLASRISSLPEMAALRKEAEESLFNRHLFSGGWGDWWLTEDNYDPTPSIVASSIVVLSILLFREGPLPAEYSDEIERVVGRLRSHLLSSGHLSPIERASAVAATTFSYSQAAAKGKRKALPNSAWRPAFSSDHGTYFFFYEYPPDREGKSFGRDYLLVPLQLLVALAGLQSTTTATLRLAAQEVLDQMVSDLAENDGLYRLRPRDHISTLDQSWIAILLAVAKDDLVRQVNLPGPISRAWYGLAKERKGNLFTDTLLPIVAFTFLVVANTVSKSDAVVLKVLISAGTAIAAAIYGDNIIRRFLPGKR